MNRLLTILAAASLMLAACGKSSSGGGGGSNSGTNNTQDVYGVVSTGMNLTYNDLTGGPNDVAVNPVTHLPAVVYYDKSAAISGTAAIGALKFAYMSANGSWTVEVVDANYGTVACGTALSYCVGAPNAASSNVVDIVKLSFTSKGVPVIAYVFGASANTAGGTKQIRYAERINTAYQTPWAISVAFAASTAALATNVAVATIDPMKGVSLAVDANDRPHISFNFFTQTAATHNLYYLYRAASGVWTSTSIANMMSGVGTITTAATGSSQTGMALCPSTGMPWIAYAMTTAAAGATNNAALVYCTALNANGACSTWSTPLNVTNGCGAAACFSAGLAAAANSGLRADITYDPNTGKMLLGYYNGATNLTAMAETPTVCSAALTTVAGSFITANTFGAANTGQNGFRLAAGNGKIYAAYGSAATSVMMNVATSGVWTWLATGNIVETTTIAGEGVGLAYDSTNDVLWTSYASLPAAALGAAGNDIKVGHAQPGDLVLSGANGTLYTDVVDQTTTTFPSAAVPMLSAAKAANGTVGYTYFYQDITAANVTYDRLYYGIRGGTSTAPTFSQNIVSNAVTTLVAAQFAGAYPSLTYDANSNPFIAFYDGVAADKMLYVATSGNSGGYFSLTQVDHSSTDVGLYPSISSYGNAVGVAYYDNTNKGLKFARVYNGVWKRWSIDGGGSAANCNNTLEDDGAWAALKFTSTGAPVIAYQSNGTNLKVAYATQSVTSSTLTWTCLAIDSSAATRGAGIDLVLTSTDYPYIAHFDATAGTIRLVTCGKAIGTCVTDGPNDFTGSIVNGTGTLSTVVTKPTLQVDSSNTVYIGFYSAAFQGLTLASQASGATKWTMEYIDQYASGSSFISGSGQYASMMLNSSGLPMAFYRSTENWLKYFSREPK